MTEAPENSEISILVIDDDDENRTMALHILKRLGYTKTMGTNTAVAGLQKIEAGIVDVVFCDLRMPGIGGIDLLKQVRAYEKFKTLPFILLTSSADKDNVVEAIKSGTTDYIVKSTAQTDLRRRFSEVLARVGKAK